MHSIMHGIFNFRVGTHRYLNVRNVFVTWTTRFQMLQATFGSLQDQETAGYNTRVGGCILGDSLDIILRNISITYLQKAWQKVERELSHHMVLPSDLSWGAMHGGVSYVPRSKLYAPTDYIGLVSPSLHDFDTFPAWGMLNDVLAKTTPTLHPADSYRGMPTWIAPTDYHHALDFIAWTCCDYTGWHPAVVAEYYADSDAPWCQIAEAMGAGDQHRLDTAFATAQTVYTPTGYEIVLGAYHQLQTGWGSKMYSVVLPPWPVD